MSDLTHSDHIALTNNVSKHQLCTLLLPVYVRILTFAYNFYERFSFLGFNAKNMKRKKKSHFMPKPIIIMYISQFPASIFRHRDFHIIHTSNIRRLSSYYTLIPADHGQYTDDYWYKYVNCNFYTASIIVLTLVNINI